MKKGIHMLFVLGLLIGMNFTSGNVAEAVEQKQILRIGYDHLPIILDPASNIDSNAITVLKGIFEGLVRLNETGRAVPAMAKGWNLSNDGKTYTFTLRSSAKWSNQQTVKASDFVYAWLRTLAPDNADYPASKLYMIANAEDYHTGKQKDASKVGIKALNDYTLQVTLTKKTSYFIQLLAESVYLPVNAMSVKANEAWAFDSKTLVTNGPFNLKQWGRDEMTLVKNQNYYAAQDVQFTEVHLLRPKTGTASATAAYYNNEVDWVGGKDPLDYSVLDSESSKDLSEAQNGGIYYYQINSKKAPFNNVKIRKALAMAIDREALVYGTPAYGFVPRGTPGAKLDFRSEINDARYFKEDTVAAKKLLQEGLKEEGLAKLPAFSIIVNEAQGNAAVARRVVSDWKNNLGITAEIEYQDWDTLLENRRNQNYTLARAGWTGDYNDPDSFLELFTSWSADNDTGYSNALYDSYITKARQTFEPSERIQLYAKAEKLLIDQMAIIPLYYYVSDVLHKPNIKNVYVEYNGSVAFTRGYLN